MSPTVTCPTCGALGNAADRFCSSCGEPREMPAAAPPAPTIAVPPSPPPAPPSLPPPPGNEPGFGTGMSDPSAASMTAKGFLRSLYDFGFTSLITLRIIKFVYALLVIIYSIFAVILLLALLATGKPAGILLGIIFVPIFYLIYLIMLRIWMEVIVVFFKLGEDVHAIRHRAVGSPF
jgi:Domain of unknown function (DUF4282)